MELLLRPPVTNGSCRNPDRTGVGVKKLSGPENTVTKRVGDNNKRMIIFSDCCMVWVWRILRVHFFSGATYCEKKKIYKNRQRFHIRRPGDERSYERSLAIFYRYSCSYNNIITGKE